MFVLYAVGLGTMLRHNASHTYESMSNKNKEETRSNDLHSTVPLFMNRSSNGLSVDTTKKMVGETCVCVCVCVCSEI